MCSVTVDQRFYAGRLHQGSPLDRRLAREFRLSAAVREYTIIPLTILRNYIDARQSVWKPFSFVNFGIAT